MKEDFGTVNRVQPTKGLFFSLVVTLRQHFHLLQLTTQTKKHTQTKPKTTGLNIQTSGSQPSGTGSHLKELIMFWGE